MESGEKRGEMFPRIAAIKAMEAGDGGRGAAQLEAGEEEQLEMCLILLFIVYLTLILLLNEWTIYV